MNNLKTRLIPFGLFGLLAATASCAQQPSAPTTAIPQSGHAYQVQQGEGRDLGLRAAPSQLAQMPSQLAQTPRQLAPIGNRDIRITYPRPTAPPPTRPRTTARRNFYVFPYFYPNYYPSYYPYNYGQYAYGANTVVISGYSYNPSYIQVPVGGTVTWVNQDYVAHTVTSPLPGGVTTTGYFDGVLQPGQSWSYTFNLPGQVDYYCRFHPNMRGSVRIGY